VTAVTDLPRAEIIARRSATARQKNATRGRRNVIAQRVHVTVMSTRRSPTGGGRRRTVTIPRAIERMRLQTAWRLGVNAQRRHVLRSLPRLRARQR
jgi:hypothetical protein